MQQIKSLDDVLEMELGEFATAIVQKKGSQEKIPLCVYLNMINADFNEIKSGLQHDAIKIWKKDLSGEKHG